MRKLISLLALTFAISLMSCGSKKQSEESESIVLKPAEIEISGDLDGCFKVVDREYKVVGDIQSLITVELIREDNLLPYDEDLSPQSFSTIMSSPHVQVGFGIEFLDDDGNILDKVSADGGGLSGSYDSDEAVALVKLKAGKKGSIRFIVTDEAKNATSFRITSAYKENGSSGDYSSSNENSSDFDSDGEFGPMPHGDLVSEDEVSEYSSTDNTDFDEWLESYEKYIDRYISFMKKAKNGDASAMSEYGKFLEEANDYMRKLEKVKGNLTPSQLNKLNQLNIKKMEALQNMK